MSNITRKRTGFGKTVSPFWPGRRSRHQPSNTAQIPKAAAKGPTAATTSGAVALADGRVLHATASVKADRRAANAAVHGVKGMTKDFVQTATGLVFAVMNRANAGSCHPRCRT